MFGRTLRDSEFFYKFLLQPRQASFNPLDSGPEGSAAIPTGKPWAAGQQLIRINPALPGAPAQAQPRVQHLQLGTGQGAPRGALHPHSLQGQLQSLGPTREACPRDITVQIMCPQNLLKVSPPVSAGRDSHTRTSQQFAVSLGLEL